MRFLRDNLFLVATAGALVVLGGLLLGFGAVLSRNVDKGPVKQRAELSRSLRGLRGKAINQKILDAEEARVKDIQRELQKVAERAADWNRRPYEPFVLTFNTEQGLQQIPAFPIDDWLYGQYDLTFTAARVYRAEMRKLIESLRPVRPYTQEELDKERAVWEKRLRDQWQRRMGEREEAAAPVEGEPAGEIAVDAAGRPRAGAEPEEEEVEAAPTAEQALKMAENALLVKHAQEGLLYVSYKDSLDIVLPGPESVPPTVSQIWYAQVNYWITRDIIEAIRRTMEDHARNLAEGQPLSVLNAPVKELVKIEIDERLVAAPKADDRDRRIERVNTLTQRGSDRRCDVLHYNFTVVMPLRHLIALERNLLRRNQHVILGFRADQVPAQVAQRYYGTDPVMKVTLQGELLLLTAWTRGTQRDSLLTASDILNWRRFTRNLTRQGQQDRPSPGKHTWSLLSEGLRRRLVGGTLNRPTMTSVLREFNRLLESRNFYDAESWKDVPLGAWESGLLTKLQNGKIKKSEIPHLNRALLRAAFPAEIAKSQYVPAMMPAAAAREAGSSGRPRR